MNNNVFQIYFIQYQPVATPHPGEPSTGIWSRTLNLPRGDVKNVNGVALRQVVIDFVNGLRASVCKY